MTRTEASERYQIPIEILEEYEKWDFCRAGKQAEGAWQYDDEDLERLSMIMTLSVIGFEKKEIEQYMRLYLKGDTTSAERLRILQKKRDRMLDEIHIQEKQLENLDYLRYKTNTGEKSENVTQKEVTESTGVN